MYQPLADLLRPQTLDEVYGQEHILGKGAVLRRLVDSGKIPNMVFYGPSGTGKTTVANIIAKQSGRTLCKLNATTASTADIKNIVAQLDTFMAPNGVLLYLDEIQSFNKKQQQSLLEHIENGKITLIASTTENPYFYVFNAILSRSTVFEFKQIDSKAALQAVRRAVSFMEQRTALTAVPEEGALEYIAMSCGGDLRKAMNAVEVLFSAGIPEGDQLPLTLADAVPTGTETTTMIFCLPSRSPSGAPIRMPPAITWPGSWKRDRCSPPAAVSWSSRRRTSAWPSPRSSPSSTPVWTWPSSWACRKPGSLWETRLC